MQSSVGFISICSYLESIAETIAIGYHAVETQWARFSYAIIIPINRQHARANGARWLARRTDAVAAYFRRSYSGQRSLHRAPKCNVKCLFMHKRELVDTRFAPCGFSVRARTKCPAIFPAYRDQRASDDNLRSLGVQVFLNTYIETVITPSFEPPRVSRRRWARSLLMLITKLRAANAPR